MCLQQVRPKGVWLRFHNVERILGMYFGEIHTMRLDIRPKERGSTGETPESGGAFCGRLSGGS